MTKHAFVLINVDIGTEKEILSELKKIPYIKEAWMVYGVYDMVVKIEADSLEQVKEAISSNIRKLEGVRNTLTLIPIEGFTS
ncbi:AsnC family transcriptional regulator [Candidatus Bathyarchaeota archaeon ex4484_205]|nr:MAG: AsnC family transcriptional regulator [Candidatus Bathyarchaeota archaeon ex4484_205]RLG67448.1 MAG: Lrp/AsnC family transcriptional regulator [archaeon]